MTKKVSFHFSMRIKMWKIQENPFEIQNLRKLMFNC